MEKFYDILTKRFGEDFIVKDESNDKLDVISTGSLSLDISLGIGGIPMSRFTTIYGPESSGKSTLCFEIADNAIKKELKVAYIDVEHSMDYSYAKAVIDSKFDEENFMILQPETAEDALETAELLINGSKKHGVDSGEIKLIILDSVAALAPEREKEKNLTDKNVALTSSVLTAFFRRNVHAIKSNNIAFILVNQVRDNIGGYGGYVLPGGHALKHYSAVIIYMSQGTRIEIDNKVIGFLSRFTVKKNKLNAPFRSHELPIIYGTGIDYYRDVIDFAKMLGILRPAGSYIKFENETLAQGTNNTIEFLKENPQILDKVVEMCYTVVNDT